MRILVTGASGLLGLNLAMEASRNHTVYGTVFKHQICTEEFNVIRTDLLSQGAVERLFDKTQPDCVVHCAALADLDACEANQALAEKMNIVLPRKLAAIVAKGGARLVHVSTDAVFDGKQGDYSEVDPPSPLNIYARTKLAGEQAVAQEYPQALVVRVNFYGWSLSGTRSLAEFFFNNLKAGNQVPGFKDVLFCPLLANDLAKILLRMIEKQLYGLYHVVSSQSISKYDFGMNLARIFGLDADLIYPSSISQIGLVASRSPRLTLSTEKASKVLGESLPGIRWGLTNFFDLYQQGYPQKLRALRSEG